MIAGPARGRLVRLGLLAAVLLALAVGAAPRPAAAQAVGERIRSFDARIAIDRSGTVEVTEVITYDFGANARHGILREIPVRFPYDDVKRGYDRVTPLDVTAVSADSGTPSQYSTSTSGSTETIKVGDKDTTITGVHEYTISYRLRGAINHFADHDELFLNVTGNGWPVPIDAVSATVAGQGLRDVACYQGPAGSRLGCSTSARVESGTARFAQAGLAAHAGMTIVVAVEPGTISPRPTPILEQRWTPAVGFAARPNTVVPAGMMAAGAVGAFVLLGARRGRDHRYVGSAVDVAFGNAGGPEERVPLRDGDPIVVEFVPPDGLRPGQVGTLIDEQANTLDVTATIVDLAVRGYLRITEVPGTGRHHTSDWTLESLKPGADLKPYETTLLTALFAGGPVVQLSALKNTFSTHLKAVEDQLYEDMIANGWYRRRPDQTRTQAGCLAVVTIVVGIGITAALAAGTSFGLLGLPIVLLGLLMIFGAKAMPSRTAKGYAAFRRVLGFKRFIDESEKERARFAEEQHLFSEYLPYAIVFGATEIWARTFAGLGAQPPATDWYVGPGPFDLLVFSHAVTSFTTSATGTIASVPASTGGSGFSGGGFSGGGFGGGGGGSW